MIDEEGKVRFCSTCKHNQRPGECDLKLDHWNGPAYCLGDNVSDFKYRLWEEREPEPEPEPELSYDASKYPEITATEVVLAQQQTVNHLYKMIAASYCERKECEAYKEFKDFWENICPYKVEPEPAEVPDHVFDELSYKCGTWLQGSWANPQIIFPGKVYYWNTRGNLYEIACYHTGEEDIYG